MNLETQEAVDRYCRSPRATVVWQALFSAIVVAGCAELPLSQLQIFERKPLTSNDGLRVDGDGKMCCAHLYPYTYMSEA